MEIKSTVAKSGAGFNADSTNFIELYPLQKGITGYNTAISQGDEIWTAITADYYINSIITQKFLSFLRFRQISHSTYATIATPNDTKGENAMLNVRLAFLRIGKGWSQAELARRIGVSPSAVGMYEQGRREPSLSLVVQLAREFGVSTDYLLTGETQQGDPTAASEASPITVRVENLIRYLLSTAE